MSDKSDAERKVPKPDTKAAVPTDIPVEPVEDFDLGKVDEDRRIFQNGDTDRGSNRD